MQENVLAVRQLPDYKQYLRASYATRPVSPLTARVTPRCARINPWVDETRQTAGYNFGWKRAMRRVVLAIFSGLAVIALAPRGYYYARQDSESRFAGCLRGDALTISSIETEDTGLFTNKVKLCSVDQNIDWYDRHARRNLMLFRLLGVGVVVGSILTPVLSSIERLKKYVTVFSATAYPLCFRRDQHLVGMAVRNPAIFFETRGGGNNG